MVTFPFFQQSGHLRPEQAFSSLRFKEFGSLQRIYQGWNRLAAWIRT